MTSAASAATITNRGDKEVKLTITEGSSRQDEVLPSGKVVDGVCQKGCIIRLNDNANDEYELEGSESVSVEGGFLYYDSPENEGAPPAGSASVTEISVELEKDCGKAYQAPVSKSDAGAFFSLIHRLADAAAERARPRSTRSISLAGPNAC